MVIKNSVIRINMIPDFCFIIFIEYFKKGLRRSHMVYNSSVLLPLDDEQFFLFLFTVHVILIHYSLSYLHFRTLPGENNLQFYFIHLNICTKRNSLRLASFFNVSTFFL